MDIIKRFMFTAFLTKSLALELKRWLVDGDDRYPQIPNVEVGISKPFNKDYGHLKFDFGKFTNDYCSRYASYEEELEKEDGEAYWTDEKIEENKQEAVLFVAKGQHDYYPKAFDDLFPTSFYIEEVQGLDEIWYTPNCCFVYQEDVCNFGKDESFDKYFLHVDRKTGRIYPRQYCDFLDSINSDEPKPYFECLNLKNELYY